MIEWDDPVDPADENRVFVTVPEGPYFVRIETYVRGYSKNKACNMAIIHAYVVTETGRSDFRDYLLLHKDFMWKLCAFFRSLGLRKTGEKAPMDWRRVPGAYGYAEIAVETYTTTDEDARKKTMGDKYEPRKRNKIGKWLDQPVDIEPPAWCLSDIPVPTQPAPVAGVPEEDCPF